MVFIWYSYCDYTFRPSLLLPEPKSNCNQTGDRKGAKQPIRYMKNKRIRKWLAVVAFVVLVSTIVADGVNALPYTATRLQVDALLLLILALLGVELLND